MLIDGLLQSQENLVELPDDSVTPLGSGMFLGRSGLPGAIPKDRDKRIVELVSKCQA